jgi:hypothetical protein
VAIVRSGTQKKTIAKIHTLAGEQLSTITDLPSGLTHIAAGDSDNDGNSELVFAVQQQTKVLIVAKKIDGTTLWQRTLNTNAASKWGSSLAVADMTGNQVNDIIVGTHRLTILNSTDGSTINHLYPFGKNNNIALSAAIGDVTGDNIQDILIAQQGKGTLQLFDQLANKQAEPIIPFGTGFKGAFDITTVQYDDSYDGEEIIVSQATLGQAWVKLYRYDANRTVLLEQQLYESEYMQGTQIAAWQDD